MDHGSEVLRILYNDNFIFTIYLDREQHKFWLGRTKGYGFKLDRNYQCKIYIYFPIQDSKQSLYTDFTFLSSSVKIRRAGTGNKTVQSSKFFMESSGFLLCSLCPLKYSSPPGSQYPADFYPLNLINQEMIWSLYFHYIPVMMIFSARCCLYFTSVEINGWWASTVYKLPTGLDVADIKANGSWFHPQEINRLILKWKRWKTGSRITQK